MAVVSLRTGGQTGVDRAVLDYAVRHGIAYAGWCPRGGWAEDLPNPPGLLALYPRLSETPSYLPEQRTAWNVRDSHATLILVRGEDLGRYSGTVFARQVAELVFLRPCLVLDLGRTEVSAARDWLERTATGLDLGELVLNVAGPRESQAPGIYAETGKFLELLLG